MYLFKLDCYVTILRDIHVSVILFIIFITCVRSAWNVSDFRTSCNTYTIMPGEQDDLIMPAGQCWRVLQSHKAR